MSPLNHPVARTAFYCCALRADDAASSHPVCGDALAQRFLSDATRRDIQPALDIKRPAASNVARHRLIDDLVRESLAQEPARRIFILGAGFDTRAFRLTGGRWWEFDDPQLLAYKEERLPAASAPNALVRVPVSFETDTLSRHLAPLAGADNALVIVEGVAMYLTDASLRDLAIAIRTSLPNATVIADLMTGAFARRFSRPLRAELSRLGAHFAERTGHPRLVFEAAGYQVQRRHSIVDRAREAGTVSVPGWLMSTILRELRDGYAVWVFEPTA